MEIVEIDSDEDESEQLPRLTGVLRGLNPRVVIAATQPSVEMERENDADGIENTRRARRSTRQAQNDKHDVNYDMKVNLSQPTLESGEPRAQS